MTDDDGTTAPRPTPEEARHLHTLAAFTAVAAVAILSPGPATLLALRNSRAWGPRSAIWSTLGNVCGPFGLSAAAMGRACGDMTQSSHRRNVRFGKDLAKMEKTDFPRRDLPSGLEYLRSMVGARPLIRVVWSVAPG